jgi:hypothetical protein
MLRKLSPCVGLSIQLATRNASVVERLWHVLQHLPCTVQQRLSLCTLILLFALHVSDILVT